MTRDAYFKIAEVRNLSSMRDDMVSILGSSVMTSAQNPTAGLQTRLSHLADQQNMMRKTVQTQRDSKNFDHATIDDSKQISVVQFDKSEIQSSSLGASLNFKKRHQSIDQVMKAKGAKKLLVDESVYSY